MILFFQQLPDIFRCDGEPIEGRIFIGYVHMSKFEKSEKKSCKK